MNEKLYMIYKDGGKMIVSSRRDDCMDKWQYKYCYLASRLKSAYIQKYPSTKHNPIILVEDGILR